jgi:hypothetical protein
MPDKDYIKKVYSFMDNAYGKNGAVSKGAFSGSFDQFYNKISSDEKYAQKIFGALSTAYGPAGLYKRGSFTPDITTFRGKVLTPKQAAAQVVPVAVEEEPTDPVQSVLQTGTDITIPEQEAPKYFQDIKAFEPDIQAAEDQKLADLNRAEQYLSSTTPSAPVTMSMNPSEAERKQIVDQELRDYNKQYESSLRGTLLKIDEEDKNRLTSQAAADELYKTPKGRFYYDFVRPVYKTALETAGKTGAFGARLFNADKTADKIVEYFDFDRLAREGNPTAALNMEPSRQKGKLGINNILPRSVEALTNMGMLMGGAAAVGSGKMGLIGSAFATQYESYRKTAKDAGLSDVEADKYAITGAGVSAALEMVSPNQLILNSTKSAISKKAILDAIKNGASVRSAIKTGFKDGLKEMGKESAQELTQVIGDNVVKYAFDNYVLDDPQFKQEDILPSAREALETIVLTSIATGVLSTPGIIARNKVPSLERSAWAAAAEDPQVIEEGLAKAVAEGQMDQQGADLVKQNVQDYKAIYDAIAAKGYDKDAVERMAINAYRAKKIDEQNKPLSGIPVLNSITAQDEAAKGDIERDIIAAASGQPETDYDIIEEEDISEPIKTEENAIQEQTADQSVLREERPEMELQEVVSGDTEPEVVASKSEQAQPEVQEEIAVSQPDKTAFMMPEDIKGRRDEARNRLKNAWDSYKTLSIISDPEKNLKRDKEFYSALTNYVKEELFYRANQVKGFAQQKKAKIKRAITTSIKEEGIGLQDVSMLNDAFEEAYAQAKKIPGILPDENNDRISFKQYIKDRIKVREAGRKKGVKEGVGVAADRVKSVKGAITETLKGSGVKLSMPQLRRISTLLQRANTSTKLDMSVNRAIDATTQMIWEAKNKQKISRTKGLIKAVSKLKHSQSMVLQDVDWIKQLQLPTPSKVDDLDTYMDMLNDYVQSRRGNELNPKYTKEEISEFVDQENNRIYKEKRQSMQDDLEGLKEEEIIPDDVSLDEYIGMLSSQQPSKFEEGISKKQEILKQELKTKLGYLKERIPEFEGMEKDVVTKLVRLDPAYLNAVDLIKLNNVLNNIAEFGTLDAAGDIITSYQAKKATEELAAGGDKIRELPHEDIIKKKNLSNIMAALFYNDTAISNFREKTIGPIERKLSPVFRKTQQMVQSFVELNKKHKIGAAANARLHAYSYLNQYKGFESGEIADDLKARLDDLIDDAKYLLDKGNQVKASARKPYIDNATSRLEALKKLGFIDYGISKKSVEDEGKTITGKPRKKTQRDLWIKINENFDSDNPLGSLNSAWDKMSSGEKDVYQFVRNSYDALTDKLEFVTRTYAGKDFKRERNYVSLVAKRKDGKGFDDKEMSDQTDITYNLKSLNSKPSGTTTSRVEKKPEDIYYDGDFFSNFVNRYYQSLYTAEVLPELQTVAKTVNSFDFEKYISGQIDKGFKGEKGAKNYDQFKNKLIQAVNEGKYSPFFRRESKGVLDNAATRIMSGGVKLALNNVWQGPAQLAPAILHNFAIADSKATAFAIGSAFKSLWNRQYAKDRGAFLENFTGVKRSALGSQAYENYIDRISDQPGWWVNAKALSDKIHKASAFSLERGDQAAQNTAYISGYITSLLKQRIIKDPADFVFAAHAKKPNEKALAFAEQTASAINNESAREYKPDVLKDSDKAKYLWMLQGFSLNAYQNAMNKAKIIWDNRSTTADRNEAALHFMGYLGEMATYQLVKGTARGFQAAIAGALIAVLFGIKGGESEEEKEEKRKKERIRTGANALADITLSNQNALVQGAFKSAINLGYMGWAKAQAREKRKEAKEMGKKFDPRGTYLSPYFAPFYGVEGAGGGVEFYSDAAKKGVEAMTDVMGWANDPDREQKKSDEQKEFEAIGKKLNISMTAAAILLRSSDLTILNRKMQQQLQGAAKKKKTAATGTARSNRSRRKRVIRKTDNK